MKLVIILLSLFLFNTSVLSQTSEDSYVFRSVSPKGGFYYDHVEDVQPTVSGFIWIRMQRALYRFDGYEYKDYTPYFISLNENIRWSFNDTAVDSKDNLYITTNNGLYCYNQVNDSFQLILNIPCTRLFIDKTDRIWLTIDSHLYRYDGLTKELVLIKYSGGPHISYFDCNDESVFFATRYDRIYYQSYDKIETDSLALYHLFPRGTAIKDIHLCGNKMYSLLSNGMVEMDIETKQTGWLFNPEEFPAKNIQVNNFQFDKYGKIWLTTQKGLYILNPENKSYHLYTHSEEDNFSIVNNSIGTISKDKQGNFWLGTYSGGLIYTNLDEKRWFRSYTTRNTPLNHNIVSCFAEDDKYLWIGTEGGGVSRVNRDTKELLIYNTSPKSPAVLSSDNIKSLVAQEGKLWISMYRGGLNCLDVKSNIIKRFTASSNEPNGLITNNLRKIIPEGEEGMWIAYQLPETRISFLSYHTNQFTHFSLDTDDNSYIFDICRGGDNTLWIITARKLYKFNTLTKETTDITSGRVPHLNAQTICIDNGENVWIGSTGHGLAKYNPLTDKLTFHKNISDNGKLNIYSIIATEDGFLWLGTAQGLYRYKIIDDTFMKFDENDGLPGTVFYPLATYRTSTGKLLFGSSYGFTAIQPEKFELNTFKPNVIISDFYIDHVSALSVLGGNISGTSQTEIVLNHKQSNFGFQFSTDSYLIPEKNKYKYRLKGYDERWITLAGQNRIAMYSKVPPGKYFLEVMACNNDGMWNDIPTVLSIIRLPAPWLSWKAYVLYTLLALSIIGVIIYYYDEKKKLKMQLYIDQLEKQKKEEIHQSQLRFFTNVSHDFRTPLTLIIGVLSKLKQEGIKEYYYRILQSNTERLLNLSNELLDFRKVQNGKMKLNVKPVNINNLINKLSFDFREYANQKKIRFIVCCDKNLTGNLYADEQILEKIIMNLLNNAFKYSKEGGQITIESYADKFDFISGYKYSYIVGEEILDALSYSIVIRDTGIGISENSIASVFERFYKVETANQDKHLGTGIGLALVKSLVLLHKGTIAIYSEREKGTDIVVTFPGDLNNSEDKGISKNEVPDESAFDPWELEKQEEIILNQTDTEMSDILFRDKKRILIAEDNEDLRNLLENFLSPYYEIHVVSNGVEATDVLLSSDIDLLLSDILMPMKDGISLCKEVKQNINTSHIPVILLTSRVGLESKLEGADSGADLYFEKPVDFNLLLRNIQNVLSHQTKVREYYYKNYFVDSAELSANEQDNIFLKKLIAIIDSNLTQPNIDVNYIASELSMSRSKLYAKIKTLTNKSIVEFILNYRLRKAARLIIEQDIPMYQVVEAIGLKSQSYFIRIFKKEFGETPSSFAAKNKKRNT